MNLRNQKEWIWVTRLDLMLLLMELFQQVNELEVDFS
jgi:hypothetical protein